MSDTERMPDPSSARETGAPATRRRQSIFRDPVVRWLAIIAAGVVVLYLFTIVSALMMGVLGSKVPRTMVERDVRVYEQAVTSNPADALAWRRYIAALVASGQTTAAWDAIERADKVAKDDASEDIAAARAELYFATEEYEKGIKTVDDLRKRLDAYHKKQKDNPDSPESKGAEIHSNYWTTQLMKAEALAKMGDTKGSIKEFTVYLKAKPAAADVLIRRAQLRAEAGDTKGAEADLKQALKYLPDDPTALAELKKIGADQ